MKTITLLIVILLYICAGSVFAGNDKSLGGGVPENIDGGIPKIIDGGVPKTLDGGVPKKLDWKILNNTDGDITNKIDSTKAAGKQIAPAINNPTNAMVNTSWQIGFRVDEIVKDQGFISRNQCRVNVYLNSLFFIVMTNTDNLISGDWLGGLVNEFRESGVMTNYNEQFRVIIPTTQLRIIKPPKYDKF